MREEQQQEEIRVMREAWGDPARGKEMLEIVGCPSIADDLVAQRWIAKFYRYSATPGVAHEVNRMYETTDVRSVLPSIHVPTLAVRRDDPTHPPAELDYIVQRVPGAQGASIPGVDFSPLFGDLDPTFEMVQKFLGSVREEEAELDRVLATVLFTDIVDSTATAAVMGDAKWRALIEEHDKLARSMVSRFRGTFVRGTGDGMLATFDGPARAVRCAEALVEAIKPHGVEIRAGCHTGEITFGGNDLAGLGVHVAARVASMAGTSEVWASSTVKDLTAGSGLSFEDAGEHELKGVPDRWRLYQVVPSVSPARRRR
jgi:class 3 adenylate cyclase